MCRAGNRKQNPILLWDGVTFPPIATAPEAGSRELGGHLLCQSEETGGLCEWGGQKGPADSGPPRAGSRLGEDRGTARKAMVVGSESCVPGPGQMEREWLLGGGPRASGVWPESWSRGPPAAFSTQGPGFRDLGQAELMVLPGRACVRACVRARIGVCFWAWRWWVEGCVRTD